MLHRFTVARTQSPNAPAECVCVCWKTQSTSGTALAHTRSSAILSGQNSTQKNITGRSPTTRHNVATGNVLNIFSQPNKPDVPGWTPFFVPVVASPERSFTCNYLNPAGGMRFSQESGEKPNKNSADTTGADQGPVRIINIWWAEEEKKTTGQKLRVDTPSYRGNGSVSELFRNWRS